MTLIELHVEIHHIYSCQDLDSLLRHFDFMMLVYPDNSVILFSRAYHFMILIVI